jgi:hypothetical protein
MNNIVLATLVTRPICLHYLGFHYQQALPCQLLLVSVGFSTEVELLIDKDHTFKVLKYQVCDTVTGNVHKCSLDVCC